MAYNKRNWKARQGTGLNFFSIDGATPVPIVNQPTTLTEAGDALSAGNLNDWEQRIEDAFDDADASIANVQGNLETYETTNDMRVAANSQDIQNIKNALSGTVIQEHVDSTQKNVKTILSADELLPWAILKRVGARSTQWNQLSNSLETSFYYDSYNATTYEHTISLKDTSVTWARINLNSKKVPIGHKVLVALSGTLTQSEVQFYDETASPTQITSGVTWSGTNAFVIHTMASTEISFQAYGFFNVNPTGSATEKVLCRDLTLIFGAGNEPSLATIQSDYAWMLVPSDFNAGDIYDVPPLSFLYRGTNQFDEVTEGGFIDESTGENTPNADTLRAKNYIPVIPNTAYYLPPTPKVYTIYWYDINKNFISRVYRGSTVDASFTSPANAYYLRFCTYDSYGTTYKHDIMICLNSVTDKTYKQANHRTIDTSFMAGKKYVNSSCYDYAENVYVNGILKRKNQTVVGSVDLGDFGWYKASTGSMDYFESLTGISDCVSYYGDGYAVPDFLCGMFTPNNQSNFLASPYNICQQVYATGNKILVSAPVGKYADASAFKTAMAGVILYYELATLPDPTYGDPIPNIPCEDGSTITAITPQTDIVNAIDVPSTIGYSTKIA